MKTAIDILFIAITAFLVFVFYRGSSKMYSPRTGALLTAVLLVILTVQALLAQKGVFEKFDSVPPRILFTAAPWFLLSLALLVLPRTGALLKTISQASLSGVQAYRIPVELVLWGLVLEKIIPVQMSFEGRNFDIFSGILGGLVGLLLWRGYKLSRFVLIFWNLAGIILLFNIIIIALLSAPTPFRYFMNEPANTIIGTFPYVWLPGFVAPMAFLIHVLSIRKAMSEQD